MTGYPLFSIILPVLDEEANLPLIVYMLLKVAQENHFDTQLLVIEDNSSDRTRIVAAKLKQFYKDKIDLIFRKNQRGLGTAYRDALAHIKGDYVVIMDADLSHHPKYLLLMIKKMQESNLDLVFSSRYTNKGGIVGWPFFRKVNSRCANFIACKALNVNVSDFTGSYRLFTKAAFMKIVKQTKSWGFGCQMEIIVLAYLNKLKIGSVPIIFVERIFGKSKISMQEIKHYLLGIFNLLFYVPST